MPPGALALVLLAGLIHASWNIAAKKAGGDIRFAAFTTIVNALAWAPLGFWLAWRDVPGWGVGEWTLLAVSAVLHSGVIVFFVRIDTVSPRAQYSRGFPRPSP